MPDRIPTFKPPWINRPARSKKTVPRDQRWAGYGKRTWKLARQERLVLDNYTCQSCGRVVHGKEAHVHHVIAKSDGGTDLLDNLKTMCLQCHSRHEGWRAANASMKKRNG